MCVHRRIRIFQLHNSKIPKTRVQDPKGRKAGSSHNNIAPADISFPAANSRIPKPPSKTLKKKAQQQQRFFTVSLRVFFFLRCEFCSSVRIEHFCCYICFVAGGFFKQEEAQEQEESLHHHHEVCHVVPVFWFFVFFFFFCCGLGSWCSPCKRVLFSKPSLV